MQSVTRFLPSVEGPTNVVREAWDRMGGLPGGAAAFSRLVGLMAPYTSTIGARVVELRTNYGRVELPDRPSVRNHLRSIHAVALANLAELTGNVVVAYSLPDDARFIVAGMSIEYLKKARGTITGECEVDVPTGNERREIEVPVTMRDDHGDVVATAVLRSLLGPKKSR